MDWLCEACKHAKATHPLEATLCGACSWRAVREKSRTLLKALEVPLFERYQARPNPAPPIPSIAPADPEISSEDLLIMRELAHAVGEDPAGVLQRVQSDTVNGAAPVYRAEWNRLMARFITRLERSWAAS